MGGGLVKGLGSWEARRRGSQAATGGEERLTESDGPYALMRISILDTVNIQTCDY